MPVLTGDIVNGKYRVEHVLGEGGMGLVVAARHLELEELYAIKVMKREALGGDAYAEHRFIGEARAAARLKGEHVAHVHDIGRLDTGELYMVMEYLKGTDLKKLVRKQGRLPVQAAVTYVLQTCEALAEAHALGIIHRDIKPHNLFLTETGNSIKVLDFGISKQHTAEGVDFTGSNVMLGTLSYMSPEQMEQSKRVDARSDVWSIGVVLYELVTGKVPFPGQGILEIVTRVSTEAPTPPSHLQPELPTAVDAVVERCLQRDPARRFESVDELAKALRSLMVTSSTGVASSSARSSTGAAPPIAPQPVSYVAASSLDSNPPASSVSDVKTVKKRKRSLVEKPAPAFHLTEAQTQPALRTKAGSEPTWSVKGSRHRARRGWRWAIGLGSLGFAVLTIVSFNGWLRGPVPTPQSSAETHEMSPSANVQQSNESVHEASPSANVRPPSESTHESSPSANVRPPSESTHESSPSAEVRRPMDQPYEASPSTNVRRPSEGPHDAGRNTNTPVDPPNGRASAVAPKKLTRKATAIAKGSVPPAPANLKDNAPRAETRTNCSVIYGKEFSISVDVSSYTRERRSQAILNSICSGDPVSTQLCCARRQID